MAHDLLHLLDAGRVDRIGLAQALIGENLAALLIEGLLDVAGDVDLRNADQAGLLDLAVGVV